MDQSTVEDLCRRGKYSQALNKLEAFPASTWRDTTHLRCLRATGKHKEALELAQKLHNRLNQPDAEQAITTSERNHQLRYIALVLAEQNKADESCAILNKLVTGNPNVASLRREYALALSNSGKLDAAEDQLVNALRLQPQHSNSLAQLARLYCRTGRAAQGYNTYLRAATLEPDNPAHLQRLVYWSNYCEQATQQHNYQLARKWANAKHPEAQEDSPTWAARQVDKQIKIAFVSTDFYASARSFFVVPLLQALDRQQFHVTAYSDTKKVDAMSNTIEGLCNLWRDSSGMSDAELSTQISADEIDILVDLSGHGANNRLGVFAKNAAPIQVSWLGYPSTTGLGNIAFRITDRFADPVGTDDAFYTEQLIRLPSGFLCYQPLASAPEIAASYGGDTIRFASFNSLAKISGECIDLWASAMHAVPGSTLYLKRQPLENSNCKNYFIEQFARRGIASERLILSTSKAKIEQHLNEYNHVDIALDTVPYNGTTTTLEALWMGVPVVSLIGNTHAGRVSSSILHRLNLGNLACQDATEFVDRVQELVNHSAARSGLRAGLRDTMRKSSVMDNQQFASEFGAALVKRWQNWCDQRAQQPSKQHNAGQENG